MKPVLIKFEELVASDESRRQISRRFEMARDAVPATITAEDFQNFVAKKRTEMLPIAQDAFGSFRRAVMVNGRLAYDFLRAVGIVPTGNGMWALANPAPSATPEEQGQRRQMEMVAAVLLESEKTYGSILPENIKARLRQSESENTQRSSDPAPRTPESS